MSGKQNRFTRNHREERSALVLLHRLSDGKLGIYGASGAFYLFLSLFPAAAILCSLLPYTMLTQDQLLNYLSAILPAVMQELLRGIVEDVYGYSAAAISISAVVLLWSAGKAFAGLARGLDYVYRGKQKRGYLRLRIVSAVYTLALLVFMLFSLATNLLQKSLLQRISILMPRLGAVLASFVRLRYPAAMLMLALFFMLLYRFLPVGKRHILRQLPGALLASAAWMLLSWVFSLFLSRMSAGSVYGSLATVVFAMFWIYWCVEIVLMGGIFNVWLQDEQEPGANR